MMFFSTILAASFSIIGSIIVLKTEKTNRNILSLLLALSSGIMLSVAFLDILPESFELSKAKSAYGFIATITALFIIENFTIINSCKEFLEDCHLHTISIFAIVALFTHSLLDGFNIGISLIVNTIAGINILFATILHKIVDGITLAAIMKHSKRAEKEIILMSTIIAIATPVGTFLSYYLQVNFSNFIPIAMSISAGVFTYISMTEIIPDIHKERNYFLPFIFMAGIFIVLLIHKIAGE